MDFVPGHDLREIVAEARQNGRFLTESEVLGWAYQLADALEYLHRQDSPIVHRDIKPSNLKVTPSTQAGQIQPGQTAGLGRAHGHCHSRCGHRLLHPAGTIRRR